MKKSRITDVIIICIVSLSLFFCAQNTTLTDNNRTIIDTTELQESTNVITFVDPVLEAAVREELKQTTGDITKEQALTITGLRLQDYDNVKSLEDLKWLKNLESLFASSLGISDISVLGELKNLDTLYLSHNQISDISALANLENLIYLNLEANQITDLTPITHLAEQLYIPNFYNNPIPEENWNAFFYPIEENHVVTTICKNIGENMPEFTFEICSYYDAEDDKYEIYKINISDTELFQSISIPELTIFGQTNISKYNDNFESMGLEFEDLNFDGYLDLRLFDNYNGNYKIEWLYFVWNPETQQFQYDEVLRSISLPVFDDENQLIYCMERGSAIDHYYSTYKYINNELTLIEYVEHETIYALHTNEDIENILTMSSIEPCQTEETHYVPLHEKISRYNETTKELEIIVDNYIIYLRDGDDFDYGVELLRIDASSEIGQKIKQVEDDYYNR